MRGTLEPEGGPDGVGGGEPAAVLLAVPMPPDPAGDAPGSGAAALVPGIVAPAVAATQALSRTVTDLWREYALFTTIVLAYVALGHFAVPHVELSGVFVPLNLVKIILLLALPPFLLVITVQRWRLRFRRRRGGPVDDREAWRRVYRRLREHMLTGRGVGGFVVVILFYAMFMRSFGRYKGAIPDLNPFGFDVRLMELDRALHFGLHPWELLHPILGYPLVTVLLDRLYFGWYGIAICFLVWQIWSSNHALRARFLLTLLGCWIVLGTVAATLLSSVGPCYFARVTGAEEPYRALLHYLADVDERYGLIAVSIQERLWSSYLLHRASPAHEFFGISAMPSLHVALPVLWTLASWRVDRRLGAAFAVYTVLTMLGSVHLGWHYALDGYVSLLVVPVLWWASGRLLEWYGARYGGGLFTDGSEARAWRAGAP